MRDRPIRVEQGLNIINDSVLGVDEEARLRKRGFRKMRMGILVAEEMQDNRHRDPRREGGPF